MNPNDGRNTHWTSEIVDQVPHHQQSFAECSEECELPESVAGLTFVATRPRYTKIVPVPSCRHFFQRPGLRVLERDT